MSVSLKHKFQSAKVDGGDASLVRPSNWNDEHDLTLAASSLLGRASGTPGDAQEITLGTGLEFSGTDLQVKDEYLKLAGGKMTSDIDMDGHSLLNVGDGIPDYLKGLTTTRVSNNTISVATGQIKGNGKFTKNLAASSKNLSLAWSAGSGGGALDIGSYAVSTTYHLHAIRKISDGSFDWLTSISVTAPNIPAGYEWVGRFWSTCTDASGNIMFYTQSGNRCYGPLVLWFSTGSNIGYAPFTLPFVNFCPLGVRVDVMTAVVSGTTAAGVSLTTYINDAEDAQNSGSGVLSVAACSSGAVSNNIRGKVRINKTRQVQMSVVFAGGSGGAASIYTGGWDDFTLPRQGDV